MEYVNFDDFKQQVEKQGVYSVVNVVIEWLNCQNLTYDVFVELTRRYSQLDAGQKDLFVLPFAPKDL